MADKMEIMIDGKTLASLRVVDLKQELEKRGLSKSGSKKDLIERLKLQLQLEKLQEQTGNDADRVPNLSLQDDEIAGQNEFIKQYLTGQQKIYEKQKEARRLVELEEQRASDADVSSQDEASPRKEKQLFHHSNINEEKLSESEENICETEESGIIIKNIKSTLDDRSSDNEITKEKQILGNREKEIIITANKNNQLTMNKDQSEEEIKTGDENIDKDQISQIQIVDEKIQIKYETEAIKFDNRKETENINTEQDEIQNENTQQIGIQNINEEIKEIYFVDSKKDEMKCSEFINVNTDNICNIEQNENIAVKETLVDENIDVQIKDIKLLENTEKITSEHINKSIIQESNQEIPDISNVEKSVLKDYEMKEKSSDSVEHSENIQIISKEIKNIICDKSIIEDKTKQNIAELATTEMAQGEDTAETLLDKDIKKDNIPEAPENTDNSETNYEKDDKSSENSDALDYSAKQTCYEESNKESQISVNEKEQIKSKPIKLKRKKLEECQGFTDSNDNQNYVGKEEQKRKWGESRIKRSVSSENDDQYSSSHQKNLNEEDSFKNNSVKDIEGIEIDIQDIKNIQNNPNRKSVKKDRIANSPKHKDHSSLTESSSEDDKHKSRERRIRGKRSQSSSSESSSDKSEIKKESKRRKIERERKRTRSSSAESNNDKRSYEWEQRRRERSNSSESSDSQKANRRWGRQVKNKAEDKEKSESSHYRSRGSRSLRKSVSPKYKKTDQKYTSSNSHTRIHDHIQKTSPKDQKKEHKVSIHDDTESSEHREKQLQSKEVKEQFTVKITTRKLSLSSSKKDDKSNNIERPQRKRKWGSSTKTVSKPSVSISTDSLKDLIPDYKPVVKNVMLSSGELTPTANTPEEDTFGTQDTVNQQSSVSGIPEITENEQMKDNPPEAESPHPPTPPQNPPSCIIHIRNLVRPFTLQQLKQVLARTGTLIEGGFWIDKIKSKCYVTYETQDQALETRQALHGTRWPPSNPKTLIVDFATKEELDYHKELPDVSKLQVTKEKTDDKKSGAVVSNSTKKREDEYEKKKDRQKDERVIQHPIREWDINKLSQDSPEHDRRNKDRSRDRGRSPDRRERKDKKDLKRKQEEETPAKLLDDLFRKTKTTPCIYWLPLTEEQIQQREQERKQRQIEREKRRQQRDQEDREKEEAERLQRQKARESRSGKEKENTQQSRSPLGRKR